MQHLMALGSPHRRGYASHMGAPRATVLPPFLREMRTRAGVTQTSMAAELGVSQSYVSALERGEQDIGSELLVEWLQQCGCRLLIARSSAAESTDPVAWTADPPDDLARRIMAGWSTLDPRDRAVLEALFPPPAALPPTR